MPSLTPQRRQLAPSQAASQAASCLLLERPHRVPLQHLPRLPLALLHLPRRQRRHPHPHLRHHHAALAGD